MLAASPSLPELRQVSPPLMELLSVSEGVYGDVMRVKILFNKKEAALVQMCDAAQAQLGKGRPGAAPWLRTGSSPRLVFQP